MYAHGSYRSGAALCDPSMPQIEASAIYDPYKGEDSPAWLDDFYRIALDKKFRIDVPRPSIYTPTGYKQARVPCLTGGLMPKGFDHLNEDYEWVFLMNGTYKNVPFRNISLPTDAEYRRYFKKIIEARTFRIKSAKDDYHNCFITITRNNVQPRKEPAP